CALPISDCGLEGLFEISRTCIIPIQRASRATIGTNMTSLQLYHAFKKEVLIPWNKNQPEELKDSEELVNADRGGFIYGPATGIHDQVGELDFTSLYPTLMRDKNLSGETVNCKCCLTPPSRVPELDYNICSRQIGIVPQSLDILLRRRRSYKKQKREIKDDQLREKFDQRQSALKWILVCSFGYLGFKNARFGKIDAQAQVLNRYYRIFQNQTLRVRGIDLRRHDTPEIVRKCQRDMLAILSTAHDSQEFKTLVPQVLDTLREYASKLQSNSVPLEELVITRSLSKNPGEYSHKVLQAIAAQLLKNEGGSVHAGQQVSYVMTIDSPNRKMTTAAPPELVDDNTIINL